MHFARSRRRSIGAGRDIVPAHRPGLTAARVFAINLNWRAKNRAVRAEYAAIARLRFKPGAAANAVVEELAGVSWHNLC